MNGVLLKQVIRSSCDAIVLAHGTSHKARPCPFIQILSRFYPDFISILSRFYLDKRSWTVLKSFLSSSIATVLIYSTVVVVTYINALVVRVFLPIGKNSYGQAWEAFTNYVCIFWHFSTTYVPSCFHFWGHSTTTWTEFCHFLTSPCMDSFYTLSVEKNIHFLTPILST